MEDIKSWGLLMIFLSVGSLIYCFLLPSGSVSRLSKGVISIVVISAVFMPLFSVFEGLSGVSFSFSSPPETENVYDFLEEEGRKAAEEIIKNTVRKYTAVPYETEIFINKEENGSININYVGITFSAAPQYEKALCEELTEALGIIPHIKVELLSG